MVHLAIALATEQVPFHGGEYCQAQTVGTTGSGRTRSSTQKGRSRCSGTLRRAAYRVDRQADDVVVGTLVDAHDR